MRLDANNSITPIAITLRPIFCSVGEVNMAHCVFYPPLATDAISCTFHMDGFAPMKANAYLASPEWSVEDALTRSSAI